MLEDDFNDVLGKAMRGHGWSANELAQKTRYSLAQVHACLSGEMDENLVTACAKVLDIDSTRLTELESYQPNTNLPPRVVMFTSSFGHLGVNAYLAETENHALIFDTGTNSSECLSALQSIKGKSQHLFITHNHPDHTACVADFPEALVYSPHFPHGETLHFDDLTITCLDVAGHCTPASAFFIEGLEIPICIVGDAIFAGSIGGCLSPPTYQTALSNIREHLLTLPEQTILCSGHGPLTTVSNEKLHNPFFYQ